MPRKAKLPAASAGPALIKKPVYRSRTNQSIAALVAVFLVNLVRHYFGLTFTPEMEAIVNEQAMPALIAGLGGLAVMFRQKAELYAPAALAAAEAAAASAAEPGDAKPAKKPKATK